MRNVGRLGESEFVFWANQANIIVNKATEDEFGWDYYAEFMDERDFSSLSFHESSLKCKIQVKSTDRRDRNLSIKLSSLSELAKDIIPSFILFIEFDRGSKAQKAFLYHVDNNAIYNIFRKISEIKNNDADAKINQEYFNISYKGAKELNTLDGHCLRDLILSYVPEGMIRYVTKKAEYLESCGYEDGFEKLTFTTDGEDKVEDLIDVSLGMKEHVQISSLKSYRHRFGFVEGQPNINAGIGLLSMPNIEPTRKGNIGFKKSKFSAAINFSCDIYLTPFYLHLQKEKWKFRVSFGFFDFLFSPNAGRFDMRFNAGNLKEISISELKKYYEIAYLLNSSGINLLIELSFGEGEKYVVTANCNCNEDKDIIFRQAIDNSIKLLSEFDLYSDHVVSLNDFFKHHRKYNEISMFFDNVDRFFKFRFELFGVDEVNEQFACINIIYLPIGDVVLAFFYVIKGFPSKVDGRFEVISNTVDIRNKMIFDRKLGNPKNEIKEIAERVAEEYSQNYDIAYMFDIDA